MSEDESRARKSVEKRSKGARLAADQEVLRETLREMHTNGNLRRELLKACYSLVLGMVDLHPVQLLHSMRIRADESEEVRLTYALFTDSKKRYSEHLKTQTDGTTA